jgi:hypothetical protein
VIRQSDVTKRKAFLSCRYSGTWTTKEDNEKKSWEKNGEEKKGKDCWNKHEAQAVELESRPPYHRRHW